MHLTTQKQAKRLARSKRLKKQSNVRKNNLKTKKTGVKTQQVFSKVNQVNQFGKEESFKHQLEKRLQDGTESQAVKNKTIFGKLANFLKGGDK